MVGEKKLKYARLNALQIPTEKNKGFNYQSGHLS